MSAWNLVWLGWMLLLAALEVPAILHRTPWVTLSQVAWWVERRVWPMRIVFVLGLGLLVTHIVGNWP